MNSEDSNFSLPTVRSVSLVFFFVDSIKHSLTHSYNTQNHEIKGAEEVKPTISASI